MAEQWSKEDKKELARDKSDESLANLINGKKTPHFFRENTFSFDDSILGLSETVVHLQGAANGQGLPQRPFPNLGHSRQLPIISRRIKFCLVS